MPLHDWHKGMDWFTVHQVWAGEIIGYLKPRLPPRFRAQLGPVPRLPGISRGVPDAHIRDLSGSQSELDETATSSTSAMRLPDAEAVVADAETECAVFISEAGRLAAVIELISPGNEDSPEERDETAARYANYLRGGANLVVVDVHRQPNRPTVPDRIGERFGFQAPPLPAPYAVVYRVGRQTHPGRKWSMWSYPLAIGEPLPIVPVPLSLKSAIDLDLDATYTAAAEHAYLD